ncbi:cell wall-binding repeat-containing protein [Agromyces sp. NPDC060279]|uniref:cell wall-binding repeat-containing protein n=1 Tax=Agromyces sp. NPDC060279 TaxID=3347092 RepID=UPI00365BCD5C
MHTRVALALASAAALLSTLLAAAPASATETPLPQEPLAATAGATGVAGFPAGQTRLAGASRYDTAVSVSKRYSPGVPAVFVATGTNFPDALSAAAAAALLGGPLLLTTPAALPGSVASEITRLAPQRIYVVGGTGAVSNGVMRALKAIAPTQRLEGSGRYETGRAIVSEVFPASGTVFLATGASFPDALAATGAAGARQAPVLLVPGTSTSLDAPTMATIAGLGAHEVVLVGGTGVVSSGIETQLGRAGLSVVRYGGASRYDTAAEINTAYFPRGSTDTMFLATGTNFPDALAGAALAGRLGAPLFVTPAGCTPDSVRASITALGAAKQVVMGGTAVVSAAAAANTGCLTAAVPTISGSAQVSATLTARPGSWTSGTAFGYQWYANGAAISGATGSSITLWASLKGKRLSVKVTGTKAGYVSASAMSAQTSAVVYPSRTAPVDAWNCPSWAPIKGNAQSGIYHVPSGQYYSRTKPEECFASEAAAKAAGYRKSKL